jgi:hypothetical protein|tara:strand:- start:1223 stop:1456 length:234 start_codon:yes stop_codon:yes gene_type:complete
MAKILKNFPESRKTEMYPWAEWFDGVPRLLEEGVDFRVPYNSFRASAHQAAKRHGLKVRVARLENGMALQAYKETSI